MAKRTQISIVSFIVIGVIAIAYIVIQFIPLSATRAQDSVATMQLLFEQLQSQMNSDENFQVAIRLHSPIIPEESLIIVPDRRDGNDDDLSRFISEVGEDYICFDVVGGSVRTIECVPFSNIASIRYFVE